MNKERRILLKSVGVTIGSLYFAPATLQLITAKRATAQSCNSVCDIIVRDSRTIDRGLADWYAIPVNTDNPPPIQLIQGSAGAVLIIGSQSAPSHVEVLLSHHVTNVSVEGAANGFILNITVTEGAGKCQFEKQSCVDPAAEGIWSRDSDGVHYFHTL